MVDIFGPNTRLDPRSKRKTPERDIISAILPRNKVLYPLFSENGIKTSLETHLLELESPYSSSKIARNISGGTIIPFDFVTIPTRDFVTHVRNKKLEYRSKFQKFIARPDFLYINTNKKGEAHIYPIDIKTGNTIDDIRQISMYNTAMLYFHSNYMQTIFKHFKNQGLKVILENGYYLSPELNNEENNKEKLEEYIKINLKKCIPNNLNSDEHAALQFLDGNLNLIINGESKFESDTNFNLSTIRENNMIEHFRFVKSRIGKFVTYPNRIIAFNGFFENNKIINRLHYGPSYHFGIKTGNPIIEEIANEIEQIYAMCPNDLIEKGPGIQRSTNERILANLNRELNKKTKLMYDMQSQRIENSTRHFKESKANMRNNNRFATKLNNVYEEIGKLQNEIEKISSEVQWEREKNYEPVNKNSREYHNRAESIRTNLITKLENHRKELLQKKYKWMQEDEINNELIYEFNLNCLKTSDFIFADSPQFPTPTELYLQFKTREIMKILTYTSFQL
ncbi:MAG: hypothetical protein KC589_05565 [Nanoarchaeota archaeon]|nr:hypothetical protein [Nanoarchaeota archaeon]